MFQFSFFFFEIGYNSLGFGSNLLRIQNQPGNLSSVFNKSIVTKSFFVEEQR